MRAKTRILKEEFAREHGIDLNTHKIVIRRGGKPFAMDLQVYKWKQRRLKISRAKARHQRLADEAEARLILRVTNPFAVEEY